LKKETLMDIEAAPALQYSPCWGFLPKIVANELGHRVHNPPLDLASIFEIVTKQIDQICAESEKLQTTNTFS